MIAEGIIRKISVGDLKNGITYKVGQEMVHGKLMITCILFDVEYVEEMKVNKFDIMVKEHDASHSRIWKSIIGMPVGLEYDVDEE
jgi:hypothetical protein